MMHIVLHEPEIPQIQEILQELARQQGQPYILLSPLDFP